MLGLSANELRLGCDCLGLIEYLDAVVNDEAGNDRTIENAICIHEEDDGILWKHTDADGNREVRRSRRLVVSWFATLDNYDYGFYWYFRQDGSIEMEVKLTGIVLVEAVGDAREPAYGGLVAPERNGMLHQHFFCFRLHMSVDDGPNEVVEEQAVPLDVGPENPYGNAFATRSTVLGSERHARRDADQAHARRWRVRNVNRVNGLGQPTAYALMPGDHPRPMAHESSSFMRRAGFARHSLWVTPYAPEERFAAGDYPNLHPGGSGLPEWTVADRSLLNGDLVLWHTVGVHHYSRPEDWPVMPVARAGFMLKPVGFFDHNPANDLPAPVHHGDGGGCRCGATSADRCARCRQSES
jgi:primary-amine oxidase